MRNNGDKYRHEYVFLIRKQKLSDLANVRLSLCMSVRKTCPHIKTHERTKIIKFGFFCLEDVYLESIQPNIRPDRTKIHKIKAE